MTFDVMFADVGPLFTIDSFAKATSHGFFLMVESKSKLFNSDDVQRELVSYGGYNIEVVED